MNEKDLAVSLLRAESEEDVIKILTKVGFWDDRKVWRDYGDDPNNFQTCGNQQSLPEAALVENIVNSVDALLIRECLRSKIDPESEDAPSSITDAVETFFHVSKGALTTLNSTARSKLAENICVVATGEKSNPNFSIIDFGEGQNPDKFPDTLMSLRKGNKQKIQFVQGKFNMGRTGAFQFCGKQNLQFILSRKPPELSKDNRWGFTIIRRFSPEGNERSSIFRYLAPAGNVLTFTADSVPALPGEYPKAFVQPLPYGTVVKLYEYQMTGFKSPIILDLNYRLSLLLPNIALPCKLFERRKGYRAHTYEAILSGLSVRLDEDRNENLEPNFPTSIQISVAGQTMAGLVCAFKPGKSSRYATKNEGILFTVDGKTHGDIPNSFFRKKTVGMEYLSDSILILMDCSGLEKRTREDIFLNSRDRLRGGDVLDEISDELEQVVREHSGLRELRERRRREFIQNKLSESKPLAEALNGLLSKRPLLAQLLFKGKRITSPFNLIDTGISDKFEGKDFPTFFDILMKKNSVKEAPINHRFRVDFETDCVNDYFEREEHPGNFSLRIKGKPVEDYSFNLWNGSAHLNICLPANAKEKDEYEYSCSVEGELQNSTLNNEFRVRVTPPINYNGGDGSTRKSPPGKNNDDTHKRAQQFALPNVIELKGDALADKGMTIEDALKVISAGEGGYDFFINMDNPYFLQECKTSKVLPEILAERYKDSFVIIGMALLQERNKSPDGANDIDIQKITRALSQVLLPIIDYFGSELEDS
ncbi:hypothetical protein HY989_01930 [Candidatus Micrarchaeota archaeon]|nr:hypothetical protein [Candidatus Micrarchaeota archaeon]